MKRPVEEARALAAAALEAIGRADDAGIVRAGGGDDFPEVRVALAVLDAARERTGLLERALLYYADADLWEAEVAESALAFHDRGEVARSALAGRDLFVHRD